MALITRFLRPLLLAVLLPAAAAPAAAPPEHADPQAARAVIVDATERLLGALAGQGERLARDPELGWQLAEELVTPHIDFEAIARRVLGRYWVGASPAQRARFTAALRGVLVNTYVTSMVEYADRIVAHADRLRFPPARARERDSLVRMLVNLRGGLEAEVAYWMRPVDGRWRIHDVRIEGISLVMIYRRSVDEAIARDGLEAVIASLEARARNRGS